jgi:hypothetical protein
MRGAEPLSLSEDFDVRQDRARLALDIRPVRPYDHRDPRSARSSHGFQDVAQHGPSGNRVQHFRQRRFHARALPGREDHGKAAPAGAVRGWRRYHHFDHLIRAVGASELL